MTGENSSNFDDITIDSVHVFDGDGNFIKLPKFDDSDWHFIAKVVSKKGKSAIYIDGNKRKR